MATDNSLIRMRFNDYMAFIDITQDVTQKLLQSYLVVEDEIFWISLAVREGVINAIKHGNGFAPDKHVEMEIEIRDHHLRIAITDEGEGFDPASVPNPLEEQNLLKPSGRGIFYMKSFMSHVNFRKAPGGGTTVVLEKDLCIQPAPADAGQPAPTPPPEASAG
ncbi:MAG: ATP-binding protein [Acidobacteria bacterium]|nr:ATP-binding protein [Acidobacteriota bacterium]